MATISRQHHIATSSTIFENNPFTYNNVLQSEDVYRASAAESGEEEGGRLRCIYALGTKSLQSSAAQVLI
jgi:hypothetical protein